MARPSKLSPAQWREVERRSSEGESARSLAKVFGVDESSIRARVSPHTPRVKAIAAKLAEVQTELEKMPIAQQYTALSLAEKLRNISASLAHAAELGAATSHRLHALANVEVSKIDDANPLASIDSLKGVAVLTRMANESAVVPLGLLAANKDAVQNLNKPPPDAEVTVIELVPLGPR